MMAAISQGAEIRRSFEAGEDLLLYQWHFVKFNAGKLVHIAAATDVPAGVLQEAVVSGRRAEIVVSGPTKIKSAGSLSVGDLIGPSANGRADGKTPGTDTTEYVAGTVWSAAGAGDLLIEAVVECVAPHRAS
jgi:hypothetical protein